MGFVDSCPHQFIQRRLDAPVGLCERWVEGPLPADVFKLGLPAFIECEHRFGYPPQAFPSVLHAIENFDAGKIELLPGQISTGRQ